MPDASCTRSLVRKNKSKSVQASVTTGLADIRHSLHPHPGFAPDACDNALSGEPDATALFAIHRRPARIEKRSRPALSRTRLDQINTLFASVDQ